MKSFYRAVTLVGVVWFTAMAGHIVMVLLRMNPSIESMRFSVILTLFVCVIERQIRNEDE